jgi:hypothetical protein
VGAHLPRTLFLHLEGIRCLDEKVGGILVLLFAPAKEAEATAGALQRLLGLLKKDVVRGESAKRIAGEGLMIGRTF